MWAIFLIVPAAFAADRLLRYKYGRRSKLALVATALVSFGLAFAFVQSQWPGLDIGTRLVLSVGGTIPTFLILAVALVELWRLHKLSLFTSHAARLREQLATADEQIHAIERRRHTVDGRRREIDDRHRDRLNELSELRARIAAWEEGGGLTRVRSVKLEEWRAEMSSLTAEALGERQRTLESELSAVLASADDESAGSIRTRLDLIRTLQLEGALTVAKEIETLKQVTTELDHELIERRADAERLKRELEEWDQRRLQYVQTGIVLD